MRIWAKITAGFVLALLMIAALDIAAYRSIEHQKAATSSMVNTQQVLGHLEVTLSRIKDAETGQRGYILTGKQDYLEPYKAAVQDIPQRLTALGGLVSADPAQQQDLAQLKALTKEKFDELASTVEAYRSGGREAALPIVLSDRGRELMGQIRAVVGRIKSREQALLTTRTERAASTARETTWIIAGGLPFSLLALGLIAAWLTRHIAPPLMAMTRTADRISRGELVVEKLRAGRRDEVGMLQVSFVQMTGWLRGMSEAARQIAARDLSVSITPQSEQDELGHSFATMVTNLRTMTGELIKQNDELLEREEEIGRQNESLQQQTEELTQQTEELTQQNEELQEQSEELDRQAEELQAQAEELQSQAEELQATNHELGHRESMLQTILSSLKDVHDERGILEKICASLKLLMGECAVAAAVVEQIGGDLVVHTRSGLDDLAEDHWPFSKSFARVVMQENRTGYCEDLSNRPDLIVPRPGDTVFRSVLASPLRLEGTPFGAVEVYSTATQQWTTEHFRIVEWVAGQCSMVLQMQRLQAERERAAVTKARLASIVESSDDAIISKSLEGVILDWNTGAERMFGYRAEEVVGKRLSALMPADRVDEEDEILARLRHGERIDHFETVRIAKDGHRIDVSVTISPLKDQKGQIVGASKIARDITDRKKAEQALRESEARVRQKLESILSPEGDLSDLELQDIIDAPAIQSLMDDCYELTGMPMAVIDLEGKVLVGVGWQDICTKFHRVNSETCRHCIESDTQLTAGVAPGEFRLYRCKNNMWDIATPILIGGKHVGNVFSGQFFFENETPDRSLFCSQAQRYGFDQDAYLSALDRVPRFTRAKVDVGMSFFVKLADMISLLSYGNLKLARSLADRDNLTESLRKNEQRLSRLNRTLTALSASNQAMMRAREEQEYLHEVCRIVAEDCGHAMVWIGYAEENAGKSVRPVAAAGFEEGYLETLGISWADTARGRGPTGTAIRTGEPYLCRSILTDPQLAPWREEARKRGYSSSVALPLTIENRSIGALTIYSGEVDAFSEDEVRLLRELADDLSHGIAAIRGQAARQRAEEALRANEEQLRRRAEELEKVMNVVPVAIWIAHDPQCRHITGNITANQFYDAQPGENVSSGAENPATAHRRFFRQGRELTIEELPMQYAAAQGVEVRNSELDVLLPNGKRFSMLGSALPLRDGEGNVRGCLAAFLDISERKRLEEERLELLEAERAARGEVERVNRMKDEFLATVSHELRSPLGAIVGWAGLLAKGKVEVEKATGIIRQSAASLTQLVEDLLDMSRIISGKVRLNCESIDVVQIINNVVESVQFTAQAKSIHVAVSFEPQLQPLECDPNRVQQIVWNLLTNAIKFTPEGGLVMVSVSQTRHHLFIRVQDNGKGIAPEFLPHIFERFRQQDGSIARHHGGLGLGLAIVKHLVELHGGEVSVGSEGQGKGATFTVSLPFGIRPAEASPGVQIGSTPLKKESDVSEHALEGLKVLSVDDDPYWRELAERSLSDYGAIVRTAGSASAAFGLLDEFRPDVLISDVGMPGEDGFAFIRRLRAAGGWKAGLPCIAVTALSRPEDRERALEVGFDDHVGKPFDPGSLCVAVTALVKSRQSEE